MEFEFKNKTILITGATRGIGKQIAHDLEFLGAKLLLTGTKSKEIIELNEKAKLEQSKRKYFHLDILDKKSLKKFILEINRIETIDGLINNAGINRLNKIQDSKDNDWDEMIDVNLTAPYKLIKAVAKNMIREKYGRIVNIGSIFGKISKEKRSIYSATKFGIHGLTVGCSNDLAKYNILVNTVSPGFVLTDLTKINLTKVEREVLSSQIPIQRIAETNDISGVVVFLLSNLNTYLTGQNIMVDGGFSIV